MPPDRAEWPGYKNGKSKMSDPYRMFMAALATKGKGRVRRLVHSSERSKVQAGAVS
jgi:hypothetical protein